MTPSGKKLFPRDIIHMIGIHRQRCEPAVARVLTEIARHFIDESWDAEVKEAVEAAISGYDPRLPISHQKLYRYHVYEPLEMGRPPNWTAVAALYCIYFGRLPALIRRKLQRKGYA
ncbi:hypothetical protein B0H67DRAFT_549817 [Lasiosphaeris hirsuta]|uniref:Uncharacterized protein n=1 Tax=Lasiosphaeris hirsuta TaxID=260670 RepID=A0AA40BDK7_9PEZI|nr:hypothetical protein B0H67DRAFT_549817 [Lasiosphaeris hirsuta]